LLRHRFWFAGIALRAAVALSAACCLFAGRLAAADEAPIELADLAQARFVHCAFYKHYETDAATGDPIMVEGRADALMHFEAVDAKRQTARAIYTRMSGTRNVVAVQTRKYIHFVDNVAGMYILTTVHSCLEYDDKRGICLTYGAANTRLFEASVLTDPDSVYERVREEADPGFCDQSFIGLRHAGQ
jgi:hypothetical protein